jgi:HEAT repeat protein
MSPEKEDYIDPALRKIMEIPDDQELPDEALCDVMLRALESHQLLIRSSAVHQLISLGKKNPALAIPKIIKALDPAIDYWTVRFGALEALGEIANKLTVKPLLEYLKSDNDPDFRAMVAKQFGEMGEVAKEAEFGLINALFDKESSEIRENAARALGQIGVQNAVEPLLQALTTEPDQYARREMCWSLGELNDAKAVPVLIQALTDKNNEVKRNAAEALGKIKKGNSIISLLNATKDKNVDVQGKAIWALKRFPADIIISEIEKIANNDTLIALQYFNDYLFNIDNEIVSKKVNNIKIPIIDSYKDKLLQIKTDLESSKLYIEESFQKLASASINELKSLIEKEIPSIESRIAGISLYEFRKHKWIENSLFFELDQINKLYRDTGVMIAELRDNALILQRKRKEEQKAVSIESSVADQE